MSNRIFTFSWNTLGNGKMCSTILDIFSNNAYNNSVEQKCSSTENIVRPPLAALEVNGSSNIVRPPLAALKMNGSKISDVALSKDRATFIFRWCEIKNEVSRRICLSY